MSKDKDDKVYLQIPVAGKGGDIKQYAGPIDLDRLKDLVLMRRTRQSRDAVSSFMPAADLDLVSLYTKSITQADYSGIISVINDLLGQINISLGQYGESGQRIWNTVGMIHELTHIFKKMEGGLVNDATNDLTTMLYVLMSDLCNLASYLQQKEKDTASKEAAYMVLESADGLHQELYLNWAVNIQKLIGSVSIIMEIEAIIKPVLERIHEFRSKFDSLRCNDHPLIQQAQEKLDGTGSNYNFLAFALIKFGNTDQKVDMVAETTTAKSLIVQCRQLEEESRQAWKILCQEIVTDVLSGQDSLISNTKDLIVAIRKIQEIKKSLPNGSPPPHEIYGLVNYTEYLQSEKILSDPDWSLSRIENRINGELTVLYQFINSETEPKLTSKMSEILIKSERMIIEVEDKLSDKGSSQPHVARSLKSSSSQDQIQIDQTRLYELYEQVICVGLELTCNHSFYSASTIKSMLDILKWLGRCTDEECLIYGEALANLSKQSEELYIIEDRRQVHTEWKNAQTTWVEYKKGRPLPWKYYIKLTYSSISKAEKLLDKYQLTRASIRLAYCQRKAAKEAQYKSRKNNSEETED